MENKKLTFKILDDKSDEEFFDAFESFEDSSEKPSNISPIKGNNEFSPLSNMYQSQPEFSTNDFAMDTYNTNRALKVINQRLRN